MVDEPSSEAAVLTLPELERWELFGAGWRVIELADDRAVVDLCTCTGDAVERRSAVDPAVIERLRDRPVAG